MAKRIEWRYMQLLLSQEHISELNAHERKMFIEFCDMFWEENVRVDAPMIAPVTRSIWNSGSGLPLCTMYPPIKQTSYLRA